MIIYLNTLLRNKEYHNKGAYRVRDNDFDLLEMEICSRYIDGIYYKKIVHIEAVYAKNPGQGSFKRLLKRIGEEIIIVNGVVTERFASGLLRLGFEHLRGESFIYGRKTRYQFQSETVDNRQGREVQG